MQFIFSRFALLADFYLQNLVGKTVHCAIVLSHSKHTGHQALTFQLQAPSRAQILVWKRRNQGLHNGMAQAPKGFQLRGALKESHGHSIYCVAWSPHVHVHSDDTDDGHNNILSYFATCAGPYATIYEVTSTKSFNDGSSQPKRSQPPSVRQLYRDVDDDEQFYACAFGGRGVGAPAGYSPVGVVLDNAEISDNNHNSEIHGSNITYFGLGIDQKNDTTASNTDGEASKESPSSRKRQKANHSIKQQHSQFSFPFSPTQDGPPLLCLAGTRGIIKVIDTVKRSLFLTLSGHGDEITDLQFSPTNEWLLLSASYDESIRLWNLQRGTNVAIFTGHDGHRRQVLSVSWHLSGTKFASCAMDNTVKLWNVMGEDDDSSAAAGVNVEVAIKESDNVMPNDDPILACARNNGITTQVETKFKPVFQQTPYFSTNKVHTDYVDCVQFIGDLILSKSVHNKVVLWKALLDKTDNEEEESAESSSRIPSAILYLREFSLSNCDSWFVRFHSPPPYHRVLALGNQKGEVKVWHIGGKKGCHPDQKFYCDLTTSGIGGLRSSNTDSGGATVRMVKFSPDISSLVAVCDDGTVWIWDTTT
eukprot:scaffold2530_cov87-Cyclotella_meneghiniana.AAC.9